MNTKCMHPAPRGFTLIELLVVMAIIGILAALLMPAVSRSRKQTRRVMATAEVTQIQQAIAAYVRDTRGGPKAQFDETDPSQGDSLESDPIVIDREFAQILMGENIRGNNPAKRHYMEFKRLDKNGAPTTPWWNANLRDVEVKQRYRYYAKIDDNYDEQVDAGSGEPNDPPKVATKSPVLVWAYNIDEPPTTNSYIIRSWDQ